MSQRQAWLAAAALAMLPMRALAAAAPPPVHYFFPDLAAGQRIIPDLDTRYFSARLSGELILDTTHFGQDDASIAQVGVQGDKAEVRSASLQVSGGFWRDHRFSYTIAADYKGFDAEPQSNWDITDAAVTFTAGHAATRFSIGRIKETFSYEVIGSTGSMPQSERVLNPFASSRNNGASITQVFGASRRTTASIGIYDESWGFGNGGFGLSARASHLIWDGGDRDFLHIGVSYRQLPASDGQLRYRGRPASNAAVDFVDTGAFAGKGARHFGLEGLYSHGSMSVLGEYVMARTSAPTVGDPVFHGLYVVGSWVLTGEARPYDREFGQTGRLVPLGRYGAPELVARYAAVDLDDALVRGGHYERIDLGLNWWATTRWKLGGVWGRTWLVRNGTKGRTDSGLLRLQWIY